MLSAVIILALPLLAQAEDLLVFENTSPTVYYDNLWRENEDPCSNLWKGGPGTADEELAVSLCESDYMPYKKMSEYRSNQIVAIDRRYIEGRDQQGMANRANFCGKQVRVFRPDGTEYISAGGDLYVWDGCLACKQVGGHEFQLSAPDYLAITGLPAQQCGVGLDEFRVVVTDKQVIPYGAIPPDAPDGLNTFPNDDTGAFNLSALPETFSYFESIMEKVPERTDYGWLGQTPAGTDNFFGLGAGSGSEGYVDSGPHKDMPDRGKAPDEWTAEQLAGRGAEIESSGAEESNSASGASASGSSTTASTAPYVTPTPYESTPSASATLSASDSLLASSDAPGDLNLVAASGSADSSASGSSGFNPRPTSDTQLATSESSTTAGDCELGVFRCSGKTIQTCVERFETSEWVDGPTCLGECVETQPGDPACM